MKTLDYVSEGSLYDASDLRDFVWSGARDRVAELSDEQCERLIEHMREIFADQSEPVTDTQINDYIWFEEDEWKEAIGFSEEEEEEEEEEED